MKVKVPNASTPRVDIDVSYGDQKQRATCDPSVIKEVEFNLPKGVREDELRIVATLKKNNGEIIAEHVLQEPKLKPEPKPQPRLEPKPDPGVMNDPPAARRLKRDDTERPRRSNIE